MGYECILTSTSERVATITLNRPAALNALNRQLVSELIEAARSFDATPDIGCLILTGSPKAFAAGADITEMVDMTGTKAFSDDFLSFWEGLSTIRKPVIAAVSGYALGGGCEIAMMCDIIIASRNAKFGQPEINIGVMPGAGGTQRLTAAIGKSKTMDLCLTGRMMGAEEAERAGLISRVVDDEVLLDEAHKMAATIASKSLIASMATKEAIKRSFDASLSEGLKIEKRMFHSLFSSDDQHEGMKAFVEKRKPNFTHS